MRKLLFRSLSLFLILFPGVLLSQPEGLEDNEDGHTVSRTLTGSFTPYAGKFEPRVGGSRESADRKLRLDIGTSIDLWRNVTTDATEPLVLIGTEFFTWTRLRSAGGFKFPVEAVDYYFGLFGVVSMSDLPSIHLRAAHISAHLVDGDPAFFSSGRKPMTYSREFVDARVYGNPFTSIGRFNPRPYIGGTFLFNTIPDTLGRFTPYAGFDLAYPFKLFEKPLTLRAGYEARLNTELEPIGEHSLRLGLKLAETNNNGVVLEGSYYSGRSPYGQYFDRREEYFSLGFSVEH